MPTAGTPESQFILGYVWSDQLRALEGKLLTFVELLGLQSTQEEAAKSQIRQLVWSFADELYYIPASLQEKILSDKFVMQNKYRYAPTAEAAEKKAK